MPHSWHGYISGDVVAGHTRIPLHPGLVMSSNNATYSLAGAWACGYACVGVSPLQPGWLEG